MLRTRYIVLRSRCARTDAAPAGFCIFRATHLFRCPSSMPPLPRHPFPLDHMRLQNAAAAVAARGSSSSSTAPLGCTTACQGQESESQSDLNFSPDERYPGPREHTSLRKSLKTFSNLRVAKDRPKDLAAASAGQDLPSLGRAQQST